MDMNKKLTFLVIVTLIALAILIGLLLFWNFYPYKTTTTAPQPYPIVYPENKVVMQGNYISYEFAYENFTSVLPKVERQFVDGIILMRRVRMRQH